MQVSCVESAEMETESVLYSADAPLAATSMDF